MASSGWQAWNGLYTSSFGYDYFKCSIRIDSISHSGNTVTISGAYGVKNDGGYSSYYVYPVNAAITGSSYTQVTSGNQWIGTNEIATANFTTSFTASAGSTSANVTVEWSYNNGTAYNSYTYTVYFDASVVAPNTPTLSIGTITKNSIGVSYGTTSFGTPSSGTVYLYGGTSSSPTTSVNSKTSTGQSTYTHSSLTANTKYYYRSRAGNGSANSSYSSEQSAVTLGVSPTVTTGVITSHSVVINYLTESDGGFYDKNIEYSTDGGNTWTTGATVTGGSPENGSFVIDNLPADTATSIQVRTTTTSGSDSATTIVIQTEPKSVAFYGSVGEYVNDFTPRIVDENNIIASFDKSVFLAKMWSTHLDKLEKSYLTGKMLRIVVGFQAGWDQIQLSIYDPNGPTYDNLTLRTTQTEEYGFTFNTDVEANQLAYIYLDNPTYTGVTKEAKKLYGPLGVVTSFRNYTVAQLPTYNYQAISGVNPDTLASKLNSLEDLQPAILSGLVNELWVDYSVVAASSTRYTATISVKSTSGSEIYTTSITRPNLAQASTLLTGWGGVLTSTSSYPRGSRAMISNFEVGYKSKEIMKLYGSVRQLNSFTYTTTYTPTNSHKLLFNNYGGAIVDTAAFIAKFNSFYSQYQKFDLAKIAAYYKKSNGNYQLDVQIGQVTYVPLHTTVFQDFVDGCAEWGISVNMTPPDGSQDESTTLTVTSTYTQVSKLLFTSVAES